MTQIVLKFADVTFSPGCIGAKDTRKRRELISQIDSGPSAVNDEGKRRNLKPEPKPHEVHIIDTAAETKLILRQNRSP